MPDKRYNKNVGYINKLLTEYQRSLIEDDKYIVCDNWFICSQYVEERINPKYCDGKCKLLKTCEKLVDNLIENVNNSNSVDIELKYKWILRPNMYQKARVCHNDTRELDAKHSKSVWKALKLRQQCCYDEVLQNCYIDQLMIQKCIKVTE